jgi:hypothetical protein
MTPKKRLIYQWTSDNPYLGYPDEFEGDLPKAEYEDLIKDNMMKKKQAAIAKYTGKNTDKDYWDDGAEIQTGLHSTENVPQHQINRPGPTTPRRGTAKVIRGRGIVFDWDSDIIDLSVRSTGKTIGGRPIMKSPKTMKLTVPLGDRFSHVTKAGGFKLDVKNPSPEKHKLDDSRLKNIGVKGINEVVKKDKDAVDSLSSRLSNFVNPGKRVKKVDVPGATNLNFSHVGITSGLNKKKIRRLL